MQLVSDGLNAEVWLVVIQSTSWLLAPPVSGFGASMVSYTWSKTSNSQTDCAWNGLSLCTS